MKECKVCGGTGLKNKEERCQVCKGSGKEEEDWEALERQLEEAHEDESRLTCCEKGREFSNDTFGIIRRKVEMEDPDGDKINPGYYLVYDGWFSYEEISFCPFCGKMLVDDEKRVKRDHYHIILENNLTGMAR